MHGGQEDTQAINARLAGMLVLAADGSGKTRQAIARDAALHKDTLLRALRGNRPIAIAEAASILKACGVGPGLVFQAVLSDCEEPATLWMHGDAARFVETLLADLPTAIHEAVGERALELRSQWAKGTARLVGQMLARHLDEVAELDLAKAFRR